MCLCTCEKASWLSTIFLTFKSHYHWEKKKKVVYYICDCHRHSGSSSHILVCCILVNSFQRLCRFCQCLKKKIPFFAMVRRMKHYRYIFLDVFKMNVISRSALYIIHKQRIPSINKTFNLPSFGQPNQN